MKRLKHILPLLIILLLAGKTAMSQYVIDVVCVGAERHYRVDGEVGSNYTWMLTDIAGVVDTLPETADTVTIVWNMPVGIYWLSTIQHDSITGCDGLLEVGTIEVVDPPVAFAGDPVSLCLPLPYRLEFATAANYSSLLWTTSGDGTFDDPTNLTPLYTFGANDIINGTVTLTLTAQGLGYPGSCPPAESPVIITLDNLLAIPTITPASCPEVADGVVQITPSGGTEPYTYIMNSETNNTGLFTALAAGDYIYTVTDSNGCTLADTLTVGLLPPLAAICEYTDELWSGANNGTITVHATGGSGFYDYAIEPPVPYSWQNDSIFTGLAPGFYNIYVMDSLAPGCFIRGCVIEIGTSPAIIAEYTYTDVTCFGYNDGTITFFNPQNGSGTYQFSIDAGATWSDNPLFTGLMPGTYTLQVRDSLYTQNWETIGQVTISNAVALTATVTVVPESAVGANDGQIIVNAPSGGSGAYEYSIDGVNWQPSPVFSPLPPGNYDVYMRDSTYTYCQILLITVVVPAADQLFADITATDITCFGYNDGTIVISNQSGGSGFYQYSIDNGLNWQDAPLYSGLPAGTYTVIMRDRDLPTNMATLGPVTINEPALLTGTLSFTPETCAGDDGTITVSNSAGGSGFYEYSFTGFTWQSDTVFTGLAGGFPYFIYMRDSVNPTCQVTLGEIFLPIDCPLSATLVTVDVTCFGGSDGSITVTSQQGGSGFYEYSIDNGASWQASPVFAGLSEGTYTILMQDQQDPSLSAILGPVYISQPGLMTAEVVVVPATCFPVGSITINNPQGGSGSYQYSLDSISWQNENQFAGLSSAMYTVYMRDSISTWCAVILGTYIVPADCPLSASLDSIPVSCHDFNNGSIIVTNQAGGSGIYQYSIDSIAWQDTATFANLSPGTYTVWMRDSLDITNVIVVGTVTLANPPLMDAIVVVTHETLPGAGDGFITVTNPTGGSGTYEYSMDNTSWQLSNVFGPLLPGSYNIWMRDVADTLCQVYLGLFQVLPASELYAQFNVFMITCHGANDGTLTVVNPTGGSGNYEYSLDSITWQSSDTFTGLAPGWYNVYMRDADNPANVTQLPSQEVLEPAPLQASVVALPVSCNGGNSGSITFINVSGGYGAYEYSINGGTTWQSDSIFNNLLIGSYMVMLRDSTYQSCFSIIDTVNIIEGSNIDINVRVASATCGDSNGAIYVIATGGSGELEYQLLQNGSILVPWNDYYVFNNLGPGSYNVMVRDEAGCESTYAQAIVVVSEPGPAITEVEVWNAVNSQPNAHIIIHSTGGLAPFRYSINGNVWQSSNLFENLTAGMGFSAYVMDVNGCTDTVTFNIGNVVLGVIELVSGRVTECVGTTTPLDISVINFDSVASFHLQLTFNPMIFQFRGFGDYHNNLVESLVTATEVMPGTLEITYHHPGVVSIPDGQMMLQLMFEGVAPGLTDLDWKFLECTVFTSIGYVEPITAVVNGMAEVLPNPDFEAYYDGMFCPGDSTRLFAEANNMADLTFRWTHPRGMQHFGYEWNLGTLSTLDGGNYLVEARSEQCISIDTVNIIVFPAAEVYISYSDTLCFGNPVILDPGPGFTQYEWNDGSTMPSIIAYEAGVYWVKVVDMNGCRAADTVELVPCIIEVLIPNAFTPNGDGLNDDFEPLFSGFEPGEYRMDIYSKWGQLLYTTKTLGKGWDGRVNGELVSPDTFVYVVSYEVPSYVMRKGLKSPITGRVSVIR